MYIKEIGISKERYSEKPTSEIFSKMKFNIKENVSNEELTKLIKQGFCFTHSFRFKEFSIKHKTYGNFKQTNYIWFDFDNCPYNIYKVFNTLKYTPNIAYTTFSNMEENKSNRFRLIYITDFKIITNDNYQYYLNLLLNTILEDLGKECYQSIDNQCFNVSQLMLGTYDKANIINNDNMIYNKNIFNTIINEYNINYSLFEESNKCGKKSKSNKLKKEKNILKQNVEITTSLSELVSILKNTDIRKFKPTLSNEDKAILDENQVYSDVTEQDIFKVNSLYDKNNKLIKIGKGNRTKVLLSLGTIIKNINPLITIEELALNIYWLYSFRCQKSDDFTIMDICNIAISVYKTNDKNLKELGKRKFLINPEKKHLPRKEKAKELGLARKKKRDNNILPYFDFNKSIKENAKDLGVCENTIRNCLKDNNLNTTNQNMFYIFIELYGYCPDFSIRQLSKLLGKSTKTVQNYKKKFNDLFLNLEYDYTIPIYNFQCSN